jgi:hypothetical protein
MATRVGGFALLAQVTDVPDLTAFGEVSGIQLMELAGEMAWILAQFGVVPITTVTITSP